MPLRITVLALLLLLTHCDRAPAPDSAALRETEDPMNRIYFAELESGKTVKSTTEELPQSAVSTEQIPEKQAVDKATEQVRDKMHPVLRRWVAERKPDERVQVIIMMRESISIPRFPEPAVRESRESELNKRAMARANDIVSGLQKRRSESYAVLARETAERYKARVVETFWLIPAMVIELPLSAVRALAEREDVFSIQPRYGEEEPPQNGNNNDDVDDGRARIVSDAYFNLGQTGGWIGLLDTGMRFTHREFNSPSTIDFHRDCVNGGSNCNTGPSLNPNDDCWNHGTSSAAIITANNRDGNAFRGITGVTLDSFKVYPTSFAVGGGCNGNLDSAAAVRGFQASVAALDRVIVAEMQAGGDDFSAISMAADAAFDAGAVVIAANGNNGPGDRTVNSPAIAHRVIGIGNFDVQTQSQINSQSRGPAPDNRFKPDLQAPTNTETASNTSDGAFRSFSGTSGATPYGSGAATLLRNWLRGSSFTIDPGQVYAQLILSGQQTYPFNNTTGAGPIQLPTNGWAWWGKVSVSNGGTVNIPLSIGGGTTNTLDAALWWPESSFQILGIKLDPHNDIDLHLVDPSGAVRASSISIPSVFERARVGGTVGGGTWTLRIRGYNVSFGPQTVYWAAHVRR